VERPKLFVGFGMVLTLLEDQSAVLEDSNARERKLNRQLQKFASITSRLLTGAEVNSLCREIAEAIGETTNFRRSVILLCTDSRGTHLAVKAAWTLRPSPIWKSIAPI